MNIKAFFLNFTFILFNTCLPAQTYYINFTANGESNSIDSVKVENLTQCTSMDMDGSDILKLVPVIGIHDLAHEESSFIQIYPNPSAHYCYIEFYSPVKAEVSISISSITGNTIFQKQITIEQDKQKVKLTGLPKGIYILKIESGSYSYSAKITSLNNEHVNPEIVVSDNVSDDVIPVKRISSEIQMQYNQGDVLKLTGKSGIYRTVEMLVPASDQAVNFTFISCSDTYGNNYSVVKIGSQWWMAENLNAGTYAALTTPQAAGTKFCMDINGQADPNCPMGGLYEWNILMQGATSCNGTGAPPNDACPTPVKGLCPNGWHIPSHYEWNTLARNAGSTPSAFPYDMTVGILGTDEGGNLKKNCTNYWWSPNAGATNITGFTGLPGGDTWQGVFEDFGQSAYFWTSTESYGYLPWVYALNYSLSTIGRSSYVRENGFSVRCVKN